MRLSVAMCTWNGEAFLRQQLESLSSQEHLPDELIVCDDGSSDGTLEILESFRKRAAFSVLVIRNEANLGYSRNFAKAVALCTGELIALADQDDIWYPQKLSRFYETFEGNTAIEGVFCDGDVLDGQGALAGRTLWQSFGFSLKDQALMRSADAVRVLVRRNVVTGMAFAFRSSARDLFESMPTSWMHDGWIAMGIALRSNLAAIPERLVGYRVHGKQQVGTPPSLKAKVHTFRENGLMGYLEQMRARNLDEYRRTASQFDDLAAWLQIRKRDHAALPLIKAKAAHAHRGAQALAVHRLQRWGMLVPYVGGYRHHSPNGLRGLPRDLVT